MNTGAMRIGLKSLILGVFLIPSFNYAITQTRISEINQFIAVLSKKKLSAQEITERQNKLKQGLSERERKGNPTVRKMDVEVKKALASKGTKSEQSEQQGQEEGQNDQEEAQTQSPPGGNKKPQIPAQESPPKKGQKDLANKVVLTNDDDIIYVKTEPQKKAAKAFETITKFKVDKQPLGKVKEVKKECEKDHLKELQQPNSNQSTQQIAYNIGQLNASTQVLTGELTTTPEILLLTYKQSTPEIKEEVQAAVEEVLNTQESSSSEASKQIVQVKTVPQKEAAKAFKDILNVNVEGFPIGQLENALAKYRKDNLKLLKGATIPAKRTDESLRAMYYFGQLKEAIAILEGTKTKPDLLLLEYNEDNPKIAEFFKEQFGDPGVKDTNLVAKLKPQIDAIYQGIQKINAKTPLATIDDLYTRLEKVSQEAKNDSTLQQIIQTTREELNQKEEENLKILTAPILELIALGKATLKQDAKKEITVNDIPDINMQALNALVVAQNESNKIRRTYLNKVQSGLNGYLAELKLRLPLMEDDQRQEDEGWEKFYRLDKEYAQAITNNPILAEKESLYKTMKESNKANLQQALQQQVSQAIQDGKIQEWLDDMRWFYLNDLALKMENLKQKREPQDVDDALFKADLKPYYNSLEEAKKQLTGNEKEQVIATQKFFADGFKQYVIDFIVRIRQLTELETLHISVQAKDANARDKVKKILPQSTNKLSLMLAEISSLNLWSMSNPLDERIKFEIGRSFAYILAAHDALEHSLFYQYTTWEKIWEWIKYLFVNVASGGQAILIQAGPGTNLAQFRWYVSAIYGIEVPLQNIITIYLNIVANHLKQLGITLVSEYNNKTFDPIEEVKLKNGKKERYLPANIFMKNGEYIYKQKSKRIETGLFATSPAIAQAIPGTHKLNYDERMKTFREQLKGAWNITDEQDESLTIPDNLLDKGARMDANGNLIEA